MGHSNDQRCFVPRHVLFIIIKKFTHVHGFETLVENLLIDCNHHNRRCCKQIHVFFLLILEVQKYVWDVDSGLVLLLSDLVDCIKAEWSLELCHQGPKAFNQRLWLSTVSHDAEVVRQSHQMAKIPFLEHISLSFIPVAKSTVKVQNHNWKFDTFGLESFFCHE